MISPFRAAWLPETTIFTGPGSAEDLLKILPDRNLAVITGAGTATRPGAAKALLQSLRQRPGSHIFTLHREPSDLWVDSLRETLRGRSISGVVSLGGGSVLDAGKALAALHGETKPTLSYLEGVGDTAPSGAFLPWFAFPCTAGTGSETSTNAVLSRPGPDGFKKSLRHPDYRAAGIALDPSLTRTLPPFWTAACGMDAITQLFESWSSVRCPPDLKPLLEDALDRAIRALPRAVDASPDASPEERLLLLEAAFASGIGLSRSGLGTCHGLAGPVGARRSIPHAIVCARLMGPCLRETLPFLPDAPIKTLLTQTLDWAERFRIPPLSDYGWTRDDTEAILPLASDRNSPATLGPEIWRCILNETVLG